MKLRSILLFGAGVLAGLAIARKMTQDDPEVLHGPTRAASSSSLALRAVSEQAQHVADRASVRSLDAIRKARGAIRERLGEEGYDDAAWS